MFAVSVIGLQQLIDVGHQNVLVAMKYVCTSVAKIVKLGVSGGLHAVPLVRVHAHGALWAKF